MDTIQKIKEDKIGKFDFKFKYHPNGNLTEIYNIHTGYVVISTDYLEKESDIEICSQEFNDLSESERKDLTKALIDLTYLYRFGGNTNGKIESTDIINQLKNT